MHKYGLRTQEGIHNFTSLHRAGLLTENQSLFLSVRHSLSAPKSINKSSNFTRVNMAVVVGFLLFFVDFSR